MAQRRVAVVCTVAVLALRPASADSTRIVESTDAYIARVSDANWVIGNGRVKVDLSAAAGAEFRLLGLEIPAVDDHPVVTSGGSFLALDNQRRTVGSTSDGFRVASVIASRVPNGVQLDIYMTFANEALTAVRHYAVFDGSPTVELWTTVTSTTTTGDHSLADLNAFNISMPAGTVRWLNGLQDDGADTPSDTAFTLQQRDLSDGERTTFGSDARSSERVVPWLVVDTGQRSVFAGLMWSGSWRVDVTRAAGQMNLVAGLGPMSTVLRRGNTVESAHAFVGMVPGGLGRVADALQTFIINGVRGGRPFTPLVTYNTWYSHGVRYNESDLRAELRVAKSFGADLFVIDAGWYQRAASGVSISDFDTGLGNWTADPARFPSGLRGVTDYAHSLGLKVGLWVEPERVALETVDTPDSAAEAWLATVDGDYQAPTTAQLCLASSAARDWVFGKLSALIDDAQPDYLKWDNNFWINCTRDGHGHSQNDGNYAHVRGLYDLLARIRAKYPTLLIENCSGGGRRLDLGLARYTDAAWIDDRTAPSTHVRHNVQGLSAVFPPGYLLTFLIDSTAERPHNAPDLALFLRSRMQGAFGLSLRAGQFTGSESRLVAQEIDMYKSLRDAMTDGSGTLLTPQAGAGDVNGWDVLQTRNSTGSMVTIRAFQSDGGIDHLNLTPRDLDPNVIYDVSSVDQGPLGTASGADLMANGIDLVASKGASAAHILTLTARGASAASAR